MTPLFEQLSPVLAELLRRRRGGVVAALVAACGRAGACQRELCAALSGALTANAPWAGKPGAATNPCGHAPRFCQSLNAPLARLVLTAATSLDCLHPPRALSQPLSLSFPFLFVFNSFPAATEVLAAALLSLDGGGGAPLQVCGAPAGTARHSPALQVRSGRQTPGGSLPAPPSFLPPTSSVRVQVGSKAVAMPDAAALCQVKAGGPPGGQQQQAPRLSQLGASILIAVLKFQQVRATRR